MLEVGIAKLPPRAGVASKHDRAAATAAKTRMGFPLVEGLKAGTSTLSPGGRRGYSSKVITARGVLSGRDVGHGDMGAAAVGLADERGGRRCGSWPPKGVLTGVPSAPDKAIEGRIGAKDGALEVGIARPPS